MVLPYHTPKIEFVLKIFGSSFLNRSYSFGGSYLWFCVLSSKYSLFFLWIIALKSVSNYVWILESVCRSLPWISQFLAQPRLRKELFAESWGLSKQFGLTHRGTWRAENPRSTILVSISKHYGKIDCTAHIPNFPRKVHEKVDVK